MSQYKIQCPSHLNQETGKSLMGEIRKMPKGVRELVLDFETTNDMDARGGAWLIEASNHLRKRNVTVDMTGHHDHISEMLQLLEPAFSTTEDSKRQEPNMFEDLGGAALSAVKELRDFYNLTVDAVYWTLLAPLEGKGFRWGIFIDEVNEMGVRAIRIVCLMNFLLGLIISMLSAAQVEAFGVQLWVADFVMIGFARELAAIMTAVVVSARTGAAIAAELATMKVQDEIDALRGMGLNVAQFLVAPKLLALIIVLPCLVTLGLISGVAGGAFWGVFVLGFQPTIWLEQTLNAAHMDDLMQGMLKTFFFAIAIVMIGCHNGLRVTGGSRGVGLMTTRAVVMDIFMLITIDIIFAVIFYYMLD